MKKLVSVLVLVLAIAVPVHLGIGLAMGMMEFGLAMLIANMAFLPLGLGDHVATVHSSPPLDRIHD